jgi:hypothetical protein
MNTNPRALLRLQILISIACLFSGLLAGANLYRYVIEVPAWRHLNIVSWGEYSRHADLGNGIFLWPAEAIIPALLFVVSSILIIKSKAVPADAAIAAYASAFFALAGLGFTFVAAPYMLSMRSMPDDAHLLQQTFDSFHYWGAWRAAAQISSFCASLWAMAKVFRL